MTRTICREYSDLLRKINEAATSLHQISANGARLSLRTEESFLQYRQPDFQEVQRAHQLGMLRVQTLRECLDLHVHIHGCSSDTPVLSPDTSSLHSE